MKLYDVLLLPWLCTAAVMLLLWLWQFRTENAGIVDAGWAFLTGIVGAWLVLRHSDTVGTRELIICALALLWGFRLGLYLLGRVMSETEDGRYRHMRMASGRHAQAVMFVFFQIQATWVLLFALPMWAAAQNPDATLNWTDYAGVAVFVIALAGEWLADRQLARFRADPGKRGMVCRLGLWRYSRHPNYFFEWLHWCAYVLLGFYSEYWWITVAGVLIMYIFITRITGIPYTEQQSLRSRGDAYREYQHTTSAFFPLPPRQGRFGGRPT